MPLVYIVLEHFELKFINMLNCIKPSSIIFCAKLFKYSLIYILKENNPKNQTVNNLN